MTNLDADHRGIRLVGTNKTYSEKNYVRKHCY